MIRRHGQSLKLNIPRSANCVGLHVSSRRPKIEVQGLAPVVQVGDENALSQALKNPAAFARAIEGSRPGFFKQLGIGVVAGLVALEFVPLVSLKLLALLGVGLYVGLNIRKHTRYDAIQACLNMINAKEKVIGNMRQLVEGLRQQIREILSEVDRINRMHGADFERLTHLARDEQRPRTDPEVQALEARLTAPFTQRRLLMARIKTHEAEILLNNNRIALLEENAAGLQTVKLILEQEREIQNSRARVIQSQGEVPTLAQQDPEALARSAAQMAAAQRAQIDDLHTEMTRDTAPRLPEGIGGGDSDLFKQAKGDGL